MRILKTLIWLETLPICTVVMLSQALPGWGKQYQNIAFIKLFHPKKGIINVPYKQLYFESIVSKESSFQFATVIACLLGTGTQEKRSDSMLKFFRGLASSVLQSSRRPAVHAPEYTTYRISMSQDLTWLPGSRQSAALRPNLS